MSTVCLIVSTVCLIVRTVCLILRTVRLAVSGSEVPYMYRHYISPFGLVCIPLFHRYLFFVIVCIYSLYKVNVFRYFLL